MQNKKDQPPHINVDYFEDLTGRIKETKAPNVEEIGQRVKSIREEKGISLEELSQLTGFEMDFLTGIEDQSIQPQLGTVMKLSKALDSAFSRVVSGVGSKMYSITRKSERTIISRSTSERGQKQLYTYKSLAPEVKGRHMEALIVHLEVNADIDMSIHEGEEFIYVVDGTIDVRLGDDQFTLEPGDSIYYLSTTPHMLSARDEQATILAVLYEG